jgi:hypothetical protein
MDLQPILNKNTPQAHMELEYDMLGVAGKLMKYVVHSSKRVIFSEGAQVATTRF